MTKKQQLAMMEGWCKDLNPQARIDRADARLGAIYAVTVPLQDGGVRRLTGFYPLKELEHILVELFDSERFFKNIKLSSKIKEDKK